MSESNKHTEPNVAPIERAGFKPKEWPACYGISRAKHQRMKNAGTAPRETNVDGVALIMREDDDAWRERMRQLPPLPLPLLTLLFKGNLVAPADAIRAAPRSICTARKRLRPAHPTLAKDGDRPPNRGDP